MGKRLLGVTEVKGRERAKGIREEVRVCPQLQLHPPVGKCYEMKSTAVCAIGGHVMQHNNCQEKRRPVLHSRKSTRKQEKRKAKDNVVRQHQRVDRDNQKSAENNGK